MDHPDRRSAYKLLKPVVLGSLAHRPREARRRALPAGARDEPPLAPDVYLGVLECVETGAHRAITCSSAPPAADRRRSALLGRPDARERVREVAGRARRSTAPRRVRTTSTRRRAGRCAPCGTRAEPLGSHARACSMSRRSPGPQRRAGRYHRQVGGRGCGRAPIRWLRDGPGDLGRRCLCHIAGPRVLDCLAFDRACASVMCWAMSPSWR